MAEERLVLHERAREFVVFDQAVRFEHSAKEKTIEQLLARTGEIGERCLLILNAEAVGEDEPPLF